ncbi:IS66 family insertion sequence element accessory protein TnpB [Rhizobiales bacterium RZME27]|uniref:IS66 family insertion sequence element accessory protein TnpB n=1 Tax=Endobacterium cereale TaxID=2663029 RepID=A0A6A8AEH6_9HYPH|nr:IS66 family insertion sequence element accessory protein TnpB [Endobacterium cereale]
MIGPSGNVRVYLACGVTDMRRGIDGLSALVETVVKEAPGSGAIFGFRGKRADRLPRRICRRQRACCSHQSKISAVTTGRLPWSMCEENTAFSRSVRDAGRP